MFNKILKFENNEIGYSIFTAKIEDIKILFLKFSQRLICFSLK